MQVVVTLAGRGARFSENGFTEPKPLISVAGRPALSYLIDSFDKNWKLNFVLAEHDRESNLEAVLRELAPQARVIYTPFSERGPIDTVLAAIPFLNPDEGVIVSYCDLAPVWNPSDFVMAIADFDMALVNYQGFHPTYFGPNSYCHVQVDEQTKTVTRLQEKILFSETVNATRDIEKEITSAGIYYFKSAEFLSQALQEQLRQDLKYRKEFYVSLAVQALLNKRPDFRVLDYRIDHLAQFGTPADTERFEFWYDYAVKGEKKNKFSFIDQVHSPLSFSDEKFEIEKTYWLVIFDFFDLLKAK
jgi:NDP-sugar pyrophosphorylase family protein